jgi:TolB-like protein/DNA-binding winged helix-turn-helix (wHTH) protein/Flp pilus assembly protein TadD
MQDVPQERWGADAEPSGKAMSPVRFAGLVFDLDACTLVRESGEAILLTRGEFRLLRLFVTRSGRVLSRDAILEAVANRPLELFDRSVDALVGRLRRKIEPDPKAPRLIATVPGEGYRFDGLTLALRCAFAEGAMRSSTQFAGEPTPETAPVAVQAEPLAKAEVETAQPNGAPPPPSAVRAPAPMRSWRPLAAAAALVGALFASGAYGWRSGLVSGFMGTGAEDKLSLAPRLSIVVLPFENMSGDKEQDYFADGITDDLTTDLSHMQDSFVISHSTAFAYKGKAVDPKEIGRDLGVRYLMEGSVRRLGDKVEVNARLVSTETGAHVWADRFEGDHGRLGDLQVELVARLASSLGLELVKAESLRAMRERPDNLDASDLVMRGETILQSKRSMESLNETIGLFERALVLDPQNARAMRDLAVSLIRRVNRTRWSNDPSGDIARAEKLIAGALALQRDDSEGHRVKGMVLAAKRQWGSAIAEAELAIALDHNNAKAHADASFWKMYVGHSEDGFEGIETAFRLSPRDSAASTWQHFSCELRAHLAQWDAAIDWCNKAFAGNPDNWRALVNLAAANASTGHDKEAQEAVAKLRDLYPDLTVQTFASIHWTDDPTFNAQYKRILEGLRKAGLPEQ